MIINHFGAIECGPDEPYVYVRSILDDAISLIMEEGRLSFDSRLTYEKSEIVVKDHGSVVCASISCEGSMMDMMEDHMGKNLLSIVNGDRYITRFIPGGFGWIGILKENVTPTLTVKMLDLVDRFYSELLSIDISGPERERINRALALNAAL